MTITNERRPGGGPGAAGSVVATRYQHTGAGDISHLTPAPVDLRQARSDGDLSWPLYYGPEPTLDHPLHPLSDWNAYGRPPAPPWGSYLDTTPLPKHPDGRGPFEVAMDAQEALS